MSPSGPLYQYLQLWRKGEEIPVHISYFNGSMEKVFIRAALSPEPPLPKPFHMQLLTALEAPNLVHFATSLNWEPFVLLEVALYQLVAFLQLGSNMITLKS